MSFGELLVLAILAYLVFGPRRVPEIARKIAIVMAELKRTGNQFRDSLEEEIRTIDVSEHRPEIAAAPEMSAAASAGGEAKVPNPEHTQYPGSG
ncbi:MAG: Sec-independent protein translocase subunit TatA/TatB [Terriglobales bacterium]